MSTSDPGSHVDLDVRAADAETELFVIDGQFRLSSRGMGTLHAQLPPGIYKLKSRLGYVTREQHIALRDKPVVIALPPFSVSSPAPLNSTFKTHEYQMGAAETESRNIHLKAGQGSWIFVFARDWTDPTSSVKRPPIEWSPARGLSITNQHGELVADLGTQAKTSRNGDPWAAFNIELNPGIYCLQLELPSNQAKAKSSLRQTIVASPGWQTQVFLLQRAYGPEYQDWRADLAGASILVSRTPGFSVNNADFRGIELARLALKNRRRLLSSELLAMLDNKFENPMFGILGGHLLLLDAEPNTSLLSRVVAKLRMLLGAPHPDVEALALQVDQSGSYVFDSPPMVHRSWSLIVNATATRPDLVPSDSLSAKMFDRIWQGEPWLLWHSAEAQETEGMSDFETILATHLKHALKKKSAPRVANEEQALGVLGYQELGAPGGTAELELDETKVQAIVQTLGIPRSRLKDLLSQTYSKISSATASAQSSKGE